jgi:hypothetical protein
MDSFGVHALDYFHRWMALTPICFSADPVMGVLKNPYPGWFSELDCIRTILNPGMIACNHKQRLVCDAGIKGIR